MTELSETVRRTPTVLPRTFQPMADVITGGARVLLSSDEGSRRALRSVGKVAATVDNVIHVDRPKVPSAAMTEVIAHELTHVAHPSSTPRFFDDIDDSPEERRAEQIGRLMSKSPVAPQAAMSAASLGQAPLGHIIRRSPATATSSSGDPFMDANSLAAEILGTSENDSVGSSPTVQRKSGPDIASPQALPEVPIAQAAMPAAQSVAHRPQSAPLDQAAEDAAFRARIDRNLDHLLRRLEDRMTVDFERRGGRLGRGR